MLTADIIIKTLLVWCIISGIALITLFVAGRRLPKVRKCWKCGRPIDETGDVYTELPKHYVTDETPGYCRTCEHSSRWVVMDSKGNVTTTK